MKMIMPTEKPISFSKVNEQGCWSLTKKQQKNKTSRSC